MPAHLIDLTNKQFGEWEALKYLGKGMWECRCSCGKIKNVRGNELKSGRSTSCGHNINKNKVIDLKGKVFGKLEVVDYEGNRYWKCKCECGRTLSVQGKYLREHTKVSCGECEKPIQPDDTFGEWRVVKRTKRGYYECKCSCGTVKEVCGSRLLDGSSKSCGSYIHSNRLIDLKGKYFGELEVLEYAGNSYWKCRCSCGNIEEKHSNGLRNGESTMCTNCYKKKYTQENLIDIKGRYFGELEALEYAGNKKWLCKCSCGKYTIVMGTNLRNGSSTSCGHLLTEHAQSFSKVKRNQEQLEAVQSRSNMLGFIKNTFKEKPNILDLSEKIGLTVGAVNRLIRIFDIEEYIERLTSTSFIEKEVYDYLCSIYNKNILHNQRNVIGAQELDIYIPDKKLAIEFNGDYWHSNIYKDSIYHQAKTIDCVKQGIRLIHIFEYEWKNKDTQAKLKQYLNRILADKNTDNIYARNTEVTIIDSKEATDFCEKYHLQGSAQSSINLGIKCNNKLLGVMTFGIPRFNNETEYELIRLCYKDNTNIIGGSEKLFKYFIDNYNPGSIISYCDISKFTGNIYLKLGFKSEVAWITRPNYKWVNSYTNDVLSRYQTQKHKLLEKGLGTPDQTEDEIMEDLGYLKIYDAGNLKFIWQKQ